MVARERESYQNAVRLRAFDMDDDVGDKLGALTMVLWMCIKWQLAAPERVLLEKLLHSNKYAQAEKWADVLDLHHGKPHQKRKHLHDVTEAEYKIHVGLYDEVLKGGHKLREQGMSWDQIEYLRREREVLRKAMLRFGEQEWYVKRAYFKDFLKATELPASSPFAVNVEEGRCFLATIGMVEQSLEGKPGKAGKDKRLNAAKGGKAYQSNKPKTEPAFDWSKLIANPGDKCKGRVWQDGSPHDHFNKNCKSQQYEWKKAHGYA
jgi:hypothetical protein